MVELNFIISHRIIDGTEFGDFTLINVFIN